MTIAEFVEYARRNAADETYTIHIYNHHTDCEEPLQDIDVDVDKKTKRVVIDPADVGVLP